VTTLLATIILSLPASAHRFSNQLMAMLEAVGEREGNQLKLPCSEPRFLPEIILDLQGDVPVAQTQFVLTDGELFTVKVINITGLNKPHPLTYQHLKVETISHRLTRSGIALVGIDHVGINLPWFGQEVHSQIRTLRERLSTACLYHRYLSGEYWDFILPGNTEEINQQKATDYSTTRRPKFELVSFDITSTPLIQLDLWTNTSFDNLSRLFPEGLSDPDYQNIWLYLQNPYTMDICLVLNDWSDHDWSGYFTGCRI
jgi:hypothetical protein